MRPHPPPVGRDRWGRQGRGTALAASLVMHGVVGGTVFLGPSDRETFPPVYQVELVAAPRPVPQQRPAPEVVERPARQREALATRDLPARPVEAPPQPPPQPADREPAPRAPAVDSLPADVEPSTGRDLATVNTSGVPFPFPEYLQNIVAQVYRRWHRPSGNVSLRAEVQFFIHRDGSVTNLRFIRRSGNFAFDVEAQGAIEATANSQAFGPLPTGFASDVLAVSFFFDPSSAR